MCGSQDFSGLYLLQGDQLHERDMATSAGALENPPRLNTLQLLCSGGWQAVLFKTCVKAQKVLCVQKAGQIFTLFLKGENACLQFFSDFSCPSI